MAGESDTRDSDLGGTMGRTRDKIMADMDRWAQSRDEASAGILATTGARRERHQKAYNDIAAVIRGLRDELALTRD